MSPEWLPWLAWAVGITACAFAGYWIGLANYRQLVEWAALVGNRKELLDGLKTAKQSLQDSTDLLNLSDRVMVPDVAPWLDEAAQRYRQREKAISEVRTAYALLPGESGNLGVALGGVYRRLSKAREELQNKRLQALSGADKVLERATPDVLEQLSRLPFQASTLAYALASLIAVIWSCGYYGIIGVQVWPLLKSLEDVLLIGFTSGLLPFLAFLALAAAALWTLYRTRSVIRDPKAGAVAIARALRIAQQVREPRYWVRRTQILMLWVWALSAVAGVLTGLDYLPLVPKKTMMTKHSSGVPSSPVRIVGSVGSFGILMDGKYPPNNATIPMDSVLCIATSGWQGAECKGSGTATDEKKVPPIEVVVSPVTRENRDWQAFVERVAQCKPVESVSADRQGKEPLLFPAFRDKEWDRFDATYYDEWPSKWPFGGARYWMEARQPNQMRLEEAAAKAITEVVLRGFSSQENHNQKATRSLNVIGFASGTNSPAYNHWIAQKRAEYAACLIKKQLESRKETVCIDGVPLDCGGSKASRSDKCDGLHLRWWGLGEMDDHTWVGRQGDVSERTVLIAACDKDIF